MRVFSVAVTFTNNNLNRVIATNGEIAGDKRTAGATFSPRDRDPRGKAPMKGRDGEAPFFIGNRFWLRLL